MSTKYILHGGFAKGAKQENDAFSQEILSSASNKTTILLVYFAEEPDRIVAKREEDIAQFNKNRGDKLLSFETATKDSFREQVKNANIIYLHGGHTGLILEALQQYSNLEELFRDKIIAGDSAGANVVCSAFFSKKIGAREGLGLLPIKIISHYLEENREKLNKIKPELETLFLPEYQFKVYSIE